MDVFFQPSMILSHPQLSQVLTEAAEVPLLLSLIFVLFSSPGKEIPVYGWV